MNHGNNIIRSFIISTTVCRKQTARHFVVGIESSSTSFLFSRSITTSSSLLNVVSHHDNVQHHISMKRQRHEIIINNNSKNDLSSNNNNMINMIHKMKQQTFSNHYHQFCNNNMTIKQHIVIYRPYSSDSNHNISNQHSTASIHESSKNNTNNDDDINNNNHNHNQSNDSDTHTTASSSSTAVLLESKSSSSYIDQWFKKIVKPQSFYDYYALQQQQTPQQQKKTISSSPPAPQQQQKQYRSSLRGRRCYFYNTDMQGRLFLEEIIPKNITSSLKDAKFLNMFYKRIQYNDITTSDQERNDENDNPMMMIQRNEYPFISRCGNEINFIRPSSVSPIVFHTLVNNNNDNNNYISTTSTTLTTSSWTLLYGGNIVQPFNPNQLYISKLTGRLYHYVSTLSLSPIATPIPSSLSIHEHYQSSLLSTIHYGLIRSSVAVTLSERIIPIDYDDSNAANSDHSSSGYGFVVSSLNDDHHDSEQHQQQTIPIHWLPEHIELNSLPYALPFGEDEDDINTD